MMNLLVVHEMEVVMKCLKLHLPGNTRCNALPLKHIKRFVFGCATHPFDVLLLSIVWFVIKVGPPHSALKKVIVEIIGCFGLPCSTLE